MSNSTTFRDSVEASCPTWAQGWWLSRFIFALAIQFDAVVDAAEMACKMRFASYAKTEVPTALPLIGADRGIRRGYLETRKSYAARLVKWRASRKIKGSPYAMMDQLAGYFAAFSVRIRIVNNAGVWRTREPDGTRLWHWESPTNWTWDTLGGSPDSRYYVIIYTDGLPFFEGIKWGSGRKWGAGGLYWGSMTGVGVGRAVKDIIEDWNPPNAQCDWVVWATDPASFDPTDPVGTPGLPFGDWHMWTNRLTTAKYMRGH